METLINDFITGLKDKASSKTETYFINKSTFKQDTVDVLFTLLSIRARGKAGNINVDGDQRAVTEYVAPAAIIKLIQAGRVWATADAVESVAMYNESKKPVTEVELDGEVIKAKLVSPDKVGAYFRKFNANQIEEETKVQTYKVNFDEVILLSSFKALVSKGNPKMLVPMSVGGTDDLVAYYNHIVCPIDDEYVTMYPVVTEEARGRWLTSTKLD